MTSYLRERGVVTIGPRSSVTEFSGGVSGVTLLVETGQHRVVVKQALPQLRTVADWHCDPSRILVEAQALAAFVAIEQDAAPDVLDVDQDLYAFTMSAAPEGSRSWKELLMDGVVDARIARAAGTLVGRWHAASAARGSSEFDDRQWFHELRVAPFYEALVQARPDLGDRVRRILRTMMDTREVLVHGDFSPKNILVRPDGSLWLIDFEVCHRGDPAFDLAFALHHLLLKAVHLPRVSQRLLDCANALLAAYEGARGTGVPPMEAVMAHVGALAVARVVGRSPAGYLSAEEADRVVRLGSQLITEPARGLADVWPGNPVR